MSSGLLLLEEPWFCRLSFLFRITAMDFISVSSVAGRNIVELPCAAPPAASIIDTMLKYVFPALEHTPFGLSVKLAVGDGYEPYSPECANPWDIILHQPGDIIADVETGPRLYCDMIKSRAGTPGGDTPNKSGKRSGASTPASSSNGGNLAEAVTENWNTRNARDDLQSAMREWCLRRDQACVVSGEVEPGSLDCAHILKPAYAVEWLDNHRRLCAYLPMVSGRHNRGMDVRNGIMLGKGVHSSFDDFKFSIVPEGDEFKVFVFKLSHSSVAHGAKILTPRVDERFSYTRYFADLFPDKAVFLEHFRQAVLFNARGAADYLAFSDDDDYDSGDSLEWKEESHDSEMEASDPDIKAAGPTEHHVRVIFAEGKTITEELSREVRKGLDEHGFGGFEAVEQYTCPDGKVGVVVHFETRRQAATMREYDEVPDNLEIISAKAQNPSKRSVIMSGTSWVVKADPIRRLLSEDEWDQLADEDGAVTGNLPNGIGKSTGVPLVEKYILILAPATICAKYERNYRREHNGLKTRKRLMK
ncbi:hypothetical protein BC832DRAFT_614983 [Gaertneriomyces semiglobifer]|nr:hypothetical protein BC832DRAFT_614983 [Gaertneriomyces semiglobifer]